jgi:hypothetical protein
MKRNLGVITSDWSTIFKAAAASLQMCLRGDAPSDENPWKQEIADVLRV